MTPTEADGFPPEPDAELPLGLLPREETGPVTETLCENEWVSLMVVRKPDAGVNGYVYSHETRCRGRIVAVLPYRETGHGREYLLKSEMTPCWGLGQVPSAITGGWEGGDIEDDAVREMLEETGYKITREELIPLGDSYASKSADTLYTLFSVDLTGREQGEAAGDGTRLESESAAIWQRWPIWCRDPQVSVMLGRLEDHLRQPAPDPAPAGKLARVEVKGFRDLGIVRVTESTLAGEAMLRAESADGAVAEFPASSLHFITWLPEGTQIRAREPAAIPAGDPWGRDVDDPDDWADRNPF